MRTTAATPQNVPPATTRRLWSVRAVVALSMLLVILPASLGGSFNPFYRDLVFFYPNYWGAQVLYLVILGLLSARPKKAGLALAMGAGSVGFVLSAGLFWVALGHFHRLDPKYYFGFFALTQAALSASAVTAFRGLPQEPRDKSLLKVGIAIPWIGLLVFSVFSPPALHGIGHHAFTNGARAGACLDIINHDEAAYAADHQGAYSPSLAALTTPPYLSGLGCDPAAGKFDGGGDYSPAYTFAYSAGVRDAEGQVTGYAVLGRPVEFGEKWEGTGTWNYFTDQSGIIHRTAEDRPATAKDPAIEQ